MLIIITHGGCLFGGYIYNLDSLVCVIPMLVFPVSWYDYKMHGTYIKIVEAEQI
jgi:hypothetical protein